MYNKKNKTYDLALIAVVAAMYAGLTFLVAPFAYGQIQIRISESMNQLVIFNKRYIFALTIGVFIANLVSPFGLIDIIFGTLGTLVMTSLSYYFSRKVNGVILKLTISTIIDTIMMFPVAIIIIFMTPGMAFNWSIFFSIYFVVALGELLSLIIGAIIVYFLKDKLSKI